MQQLLLPLPTILCPLIGHLTPAELAPTAFGAAIALADQSMVLPRNFGAVVKMYCTISTVCQIPVAL